MIKVSTTTKDIPILTAFPIPNLPVRLAFAGEIGKIHETGVLNKECN
jgi:hypothetical protein